MRVDSTKDKEKKKKNKKRQQSILEKEIMSIMHKSMKAALDMALDDILKDWKRRTARGSQVELLAVFVVYSRLTGL